MTDLFRPRGQQTHVQAVTCPPNLIMGSVSPADATQRARCSHDLSRHHGLLLEYGRNLGGSSEVVLITMFA